MTIIEIDFIVFIYRSHVVSVVRVDVAQDEIDISLVAQHNIIEQFQTEIGQILLPTCPFSRFPGAALR